MPVSVNKTIVVVLNLQKKKKKKPGIAKLSVWLIFQLNLHELYFSFFNTHIKVAFATI